jgi:hypothetical protein
MNTLVLLAALSVPGQACEGGVCRVLRPLPRVAISRTEQPLRLLCERWRYRLADRPRLLRWRRR